MEATAMMICLFCLIAGITNAYFFLRDKTAMRFYILAKGIVILYVGFMYGITAIDFFVDIVPDKFTIPYIRAAVFTISILFLSDSFMRDKFKDS